MRRLFDFIVLKLGGYAEFSALNQRTIQIRVGFVNQGQLCTFVWLLSKVTCEDAADLDFVNFECEQLIACLKQKYAL